jgi:protein required for attachment to host cells
MSTTWILIANSSSAKLYMNTGPKKGLSKLKEFDHSASRSKGGDLVSDRPGHYKSHGNGRGAYNPPTNPKQHEADQFALELAKELDHGRTTQQFQRLILVAAPGFMGLLNKHLNGYIGHLVTDRFEKDYTKATEKEIAGHLEGCIYL